MQLSELVRRIRSGEKEAVKELVATYGSAVFQRAFERTGDKDLAREAARQTFGQFVAIVQQQPEDDGWNLWFGDLIERNISTYSQISTDMRTIESELDHEITGNMPVSSIMRPQVAKQPEAPAWEEEAEPAPAAPSRKDEPDPLAWRSELDPMQTRATEKPERIERVQKREPRQKKESVRDEIYDESYQKKAKRSRGHGVSIFLLIIVSLLLLWIVAGVAMTLQWIPFYDLGFSWFNQHVFKLF
ncbi:MAG TPA: hypothetical protein VN538_05005 [Clostridia bacterium]|jgi:hypothetical protein|nr:hypothetical protein [Clostridia bacterium]